MSGQYLTVNSPACVRWTAFALLCCVFTARSASVTYPNQAYSFSYAKFSPVPGAFDVKAVAVEGSRMMVVTRDGRVVTSGFPEAWLADGAVERLTNVVAVGLNYT